MLAALILGLVGLLALGGLYRHYIVKNPGEHLEREHILQLISQESPVFYRDGETRMGVFFADEHRQYLPYKRIPKHFVDALVAAEDQNYWDHRGFSPTGIARAMITNLVAGRVVAGGSTLSQQTAKNLYKRQGRTYKEKLRELANALRLERQYSKQDILEFYSNQFYVNGNGRGLSIAARFFFDRDVEQLGLLECVFLAGVVKAPNRYNPWVAGEERRARAKQAAHDRVRYVLSRMLADGSVDKQAYDAALAEEIPFQRGHFRFDRSVVLDEIEKELNGPYFRSLLGEHGIAAFATSGLQVVSTIDETVQRGATYGLRHHLSRVGTWLEEPELAVLFRPGAELNPADPEQLVARTFHDGLLRSVDLVKRRVVVDLGGIEGVIDASGNARLARARKRAANGNTWSEVSAAEVRAMLKQLQEHVGETVTVSIRGGDAGDGDLVLDWEWRPKLQGAVVVLEQGAMRAMVGGARNTDFNRAMTAKRQFGSTWKPLLFEAALQLRWSTTDRLDNRRSVFPYQSGFYYPRPDHKGAPDFVSMAWAAAKSENLASVWLVYHLTDQLNSEQFRQVSAQAGLAREKGEGMAEYTLRIQTAGVVPTRAKLEEGIFDQVRKEALVDLIFSGQERESEELESLYYGLGFEEQDQKIDENTSMNPEKRRLQKQLLRRSFLRQEALARDFVDRRATVLAIFAGGDRPSAELLQMFSVLRGSDGGSQLSFGSLQPEESLPLTPELLDALVAGYAQTYDDAVAIAENGFVRPVVEPPAPAPSVGSVPPPVSELPVVAAPPSVAELPIAAEPPSVAELPVAPAPPSKPAEVIPQVADEADLLFASGGIPAAADEVAPAAAAPEASPVVEGPSIEEQVARLLAPDRVLMDGLLPAGMITSLRQSLDESLVVLDDIGGLYSPAALELCRDFRVLVGLRYLRVLAARSGVGSEVQEVLSLPLGSSELTLLEAAQLYQVMQSAATWKVVPDPVTMAATFAPQGDGSPPGEPTPVLASGGPEPSPTSLIAELRLADGRVLYRAQRLARRVQDPAIAAELSVLLRGVVRYGTGRKAEGSVRVLSQLPSRASELAELRVRMPLFGKTGTTNKYRNSAFVGVVPGLPEAGDRLDWNSGLVVAAYVGYDDNREMRRDSIRLAGASGSLPVWIDTAQSVVDASDIGDRVDLADVAFSGSGVLPMELPNQFTPVRVDLTTGLPSELGAADTINLMQRQGERSFSPFLPLDEDPGESPATGTP